MVIPLAAKADYLGIKKSSETIAFFLRPPLDSLYGIQRKPDSVHIFTYADNATAATFQTRSTTYPFSDISIDTLKHFTDTMYVFKDLISDIDGAGGNFVLSINVQMYYDKTPTHTFMHVQVVADSLNELGAIKDTVDAILDTLQLWDTRIDSIEAALADANMNDKVWVDGAGVIRDSIVASLADANLNDKVWVDGAGVKRDSIVAALADANINDKVWVDGAGVKRDSIVAAVSDAAKAAIVDLTWDEPLTGATHNVQNSAGILNCTKFIQRVGHHLYGGKGMGSNLVIIHLDINR